MTGIDVLTSGVLRFGDGVATFTCSTRTETDQRVDIYGDAGRISIEIPFNVPPDRPDARVRDGRWRPAGRARHRDADLRRRPTRMRSRPRRSAAAVLAGGPVPTPPEDAVANLRVIERLFAAGAI